MPLTEPDLWFSHIRLLGITFPFRGQGVERVMYLRHRQRIIPDKLLELLPVTAFLLASPVYPFEDKPYCLLIVSMHLSHISAYPIASVVSCEFCSQHFPPLLELNPAAHGFKPLVQFLNPQPELCLRVSIQ